MLFGRGQSTSSEKQKKAPKGDGTEAILERAMRFSRQPRPKYSHSKRDAIQTALLSLERAVLCIDSTKNMLAETLSLLTTLLDSPDELDDAKRSILSAQIETMQNRLTSFIESAEVNGLNLVDGTGSQVVIGLSEATTGQLIIRRVNLTPHGLGLANLDQGFDNIVQVREAANMIQRALDYVSYQNETFCANATILAEHYGRL